MKTLILMIQFFTRIPIKFTVDIKKNDFSKGVLYFPLVGLIIGVLNSIVYCIFSRVIDGYTPFIVVIIFNELITGALHLDGLADSCDGLFSARKKDRMLEIMRDSRIGTNGVLVLIFTIIIKINLLYSLPETIILQSIVILPVIGRGVLSFVTYRAYYAREGEGLGSLIIGKTTLKRTLGAVALTAFISYMLLHTLGILAFCFCIIIGYILRRNFTRIIGGLTGDLLGAINEVVEIFVLFILVSFGG